VIPVISYIYILRQIFLTNLHLKAPFVNVPVYYTDSWYWYHLINIALL